MEGALYIVIVIVIVVVIQCLECIVYKVNGALYIASPAESRDLLRIPDQPTSSEGYIGYEMDLA